MSRHEKGTRIGAIYSGSKGRVLFLGYGTYEGDEVPEGAGGFMGEAMAEAGITNPKLLLDNGDVVWGCECWWGPEEVVKKQMEGAVIEEVRIGDKRKANREETASE